MSRTFQDVVNELNNEVKQTRGQLRVAYVKYGYVDGDHVWVGSVMEAKDTPLAPYIVWDEENQVFEYRPPKYWNSVVPPYWADRNQTFWFDVIQPHEIVTSKTFDAVRDLAGYHLRLMILVSRREAKVKDGRSIHEIERAKAKVKDLNKAMRVLCEAKNNWAEIKRSPRTEGARYRRTRKQPA